MKLGNYPCKLCKNEFEPTRRGVQKFCSSKCRKKYSYHKNKTPKPLTPNPKIKEVFEDKDKKTSIINNSLVIPDQSIMNNDEAKPFKVEEVSGPGIVNAGLGALAALAAAKAAKEVFIAEKNKPATKGDIENLEQLINTRYLPVLNVTSDPYQRKAYYDRETGNIVFYNSSSNSMEFPMMDL